MRAASLLLTFVCCVSGRKNAEIKSSLPSQQDWTKLNGPICQSLANSSVLFEKTNTTEHFCCDTNEVVSVAKVCDGIADCGSELDESVKYCGCLPHEFLCDDKCINSVYRCDRVQHCSDGSDEKDCELYNCPATFSKCANHYCIPQDAFCDFIDDCGDNSDELSCDHRKCWYGEFRCASGECTRPGFVCDGLKNCNDGSDEIQCSPDDFAICEDGSRVHRQFWCDNWPECKGNHTDETLCGECPAGFFKCRNNRCLRPAQLCNALCDCSGSCEDEIGCEDVYSSENGHLICQPGHSLQCPSISGPTNAFRCVAAPYICDGHNDCYTGTFYSDEFGCPDAKLNTTEIDEYDEKRSLFCCTGENDHRCLPARFHCNFHIDCLHGEDEKDCEFLPCYEDEFRCRNDQCIPKLAVCDGKYDCTDKSDEMDCNRTCPEGTRRCRNGVCIPANFWCDYRQDCADNSDEAFCERNRTCKEDEFRCLNGQCIPSSQACFISADKSQRGCADGSHLTQCRDVKCTMGLFKCFHGACLDPTLVCDGLIDCKETWTDEDYCPYICAVDAPQCSCVDVSLNCTGRGLTVVPKYVESPIAHFYLANNCLNETLTGSSFNHLPRATILDLGHNNLQEIPNGLFSRLWKLRVLHLQHNNITIMRNGTFYGLSQLQTLHLAGNGIRRLEAYAFNGLSSLTNLNLAHQLIEYIEANAFKGLHNLMNLDLSYNHLTSLKDHTFDGLKLAKLDLSGNYLATLPSNIFRSLTSLRILATDEFRFCCLAKHVPGCSPPMDEFSSCEDLMSNLVLRVCIWVLGFLAIAGNLLVILWRPLHHISNKQQTCLAINLAVADFCMGIYLMLIATADVRYRGNYAVHDQTWRVSSMCHLAGFLSTFSSELSVYTLTAITIDRFFAISFPFRGYRLGTKSTVLTMTGGWFISLLLAALPFSPINYFTNFYGRSGVCLPLHITPDKHSGWEYSVFVFIALNFFSMSVITACYMWMYLTAKKTKKAVGGHGRRDDQTMAHRMTLIVATDVACWLPIIMLGVASLCGATVPPQVFAWVAVFILPLNAAINPILYTLSTEKFLKSVPVVMNGLNQSITNFSTKLTRVSNESRNSGDTQGPPSCSAKNYSTVQLRVVSLKIPMRHPKFTTDINCQPKSPNSTHPNEQLSPMSDD